MSFELSNAFIDHFKSPQIKILPFKANNIKNCLRESYIYIRVCYKIKHEEKLWNISVKSKHGREMKMANKVTSNQNSFFSQSNAMEVIFVIKVRRKMLSGFFLLKL